MGTKMFMASYVAYGYLEIEAESEDEALEEAKKLQFDGDAMDDLEFDELGGMTWYFDGMKEVDNE